MDGLLQDLISPALIPNKDGAVLFFPIRHHSPVCSCQLERITARFKPELILIEGPENSNDLIPVLTDAHTRLPAAIYYFYKDKKKYISEEAEDYHCYYPFLESSPEYAAMSAAKALSIPAAFIDLPYSEILIHTKDFEGLRRMQERHSYADDSYLVNSRFRELLCQKTGLRSFEEFWEKYFEIAGLRLEPEMFLHQMYTYCSLTRNGTPESQIQADGTDVREQHMAYRIREKMQQYGRILVVTGGFHTPALVSLVQKPVKPLKLHKFPEEQQNCYPIAYSFEAADALNGYASGMPHAGYYTKIMQSLHEKTLPPEEVYRQQTLALLTETAKKCSRKDIPLSIADVTSAYSMAEGLAALRESPVPGYAELWDGVLSAFIKGERTVASSLPLDILEKLATGDGVGHIGDTSHVPPLISDFEKQCRTFRLKYETIIAQEAEVPLFGGLRDAEKSRFFHRMAFLDVHFCKRKKGPDLHRNLDRSRVRELWTYCRTPEVDAALVEHTTDGTTIEESCRNVAAKRIRAEFRTGTAAQICVDCFLMGIPLVEHEVMQEILSGDGDFFSLGQGLHYFDMLCELQVLYQTYDPAYRQWLEYCFSRLLVLLPPMAGVQAEQAKDCIRIFRLLHGVTGRLFPERQEEFRQALISLLMQPKTEPSVHGAVMGLLYAMDAAYLSQAEQAMQSYLMGTPEHRREGAHYLHGLFETARDIALGDGNFLEMADSLLQGSSYADFMEILPSLRLAFCHFTPSEIQQIAERIAQMHGIRDDLLHGTVYDEALMAFGAELDAEVMREMKA